MFVMETSEDNFEVKLLPMRSAIFIPGSHKWIIYCSTAVGVHCVTWERGRDFNGDEPIDKMLEMSVAWCSKVLADPIHEAPPSGAIN